MGQPDAERDALTRRGSAAVRAAAVPGNRVRTKKRTRVRRRLRAFGMTKAMVIGIAFLCAVAVAGCVFYLHQRETLTHEVKQNEKLAASLTTLKSENDALYESVMGSIDWDKVRDTAIHRLGMKYATDDQIIWYNTEGNSYIRQYEKVP